jgi:GT2 family glycosyltransferase
VTTLQTVVVNYRTPADLDDFLRSYSEYRPALEGGLVVVNVQPMAADRDVCGDWRGELKLEELVFDHNAGYARSCNAAAALGDTDVVAFFNADVVLTNGALDACAVAVDTNPAWAALGPRQVDGSGRLTAGGIFGPNTAPHHRDWHARDRGQCSDIRDDCPTLAGAALFVKRVAWDELARCPRYTAAAYPVSSAEIRGAFLPTRHYYEETYFCYHARHHGWRLAYYGTVSVVHKWHRASAHDDADRDVMAESRKVFREACAAHGIECN